MAERKLLDFYADWCGPCSAMEPIIERLQETVLDPNGIILEKVNVDPDNDHKFEENLTQTYQLIGVPTYITMEDGQEIARRHGGYLKDMKKFIKQSFPDLII